MSRMSKPDGQYQSDGLSCVSEFEIDGLLYQRRPLTLTLSPAEPGRGDRKAQPPLTGGKQATSSVVFKTQSSAA